MLVVVLNVVLDVEVVVVLLLLLSMFNWLLLLNVESCGKKVTFLPYEKGYLLKSNLFAL